MKILGIETSCDETAIGIVNDQKEILSHQIYSQIKEHEAFGGVVPEIAARSHIDVVDSLINHSMNEANIRYDQLDAVAVTAGPGLIGGVLVGAMIGKAIAMSAGLPIMAINHLEGHALTIRFCQDVSFPYLLVLVSGGHCQFVIVEGVGQYKVLGKTLDDALGEAFDKVAKMLGLGYPGGPIVEQLAKEGDAYRFNFPKPLYKKPGCDMSFSGLKTAVRQTIESLPDMKDQDKADICASFQHTIAEVMRDRVRRAIDICKQLHPECTHVVVAGGVAANQYMIRQLQEAMPDGMSLVSPPMSLCTDNGVMIAWAGVERFRLHKTDSLDFSPKARWPLESLR